MAEYVEVVDAGPGWTKVRTSDGQVVTVEGNRNWRNNNPGNLEYGDFARSMGAIGTDGRFAVFPTYESGREAKSNLIFESPNYRDLPLSGAINRYAPPFENNTQSYLDQVVQAAGVSPNTPMSQIPVERRAAILDAMQRVEGWKVGTINGEPGPEMAYNALPPVGPTGGPALGAINGAAGMPTPSGLRPASPRAGGSFWSGLSSPIASVMNMEIPQFPRVQPEQKQSIMSMAMGSLPVRTAFVRSLMNQNVGAAPSVSQGHSGGGTKAFAVSNKGRSPVSLMGMSAPDSGRGDGSNPSGMNKDIYRANAAVLSPGGFNQSSIDRALSSGKTLYKLA